MDHQMDLTVEGIRSNLLELLNIALVMNTVMGSLQTQNMLCSRNSGIWHMLSHNFFVVNIVKDGGSRYLSPAMEEIILHSQ